MQTTSRIESMKVRCPRCGAEPGRSCWGKPNYRGKRALRTRTHIERHSLALSEGATNYYAVHQLNSELDEGFQQSLDLDR